MLQNAYAAANLRHQAAIQRLAALPPPRPPTTLSLSSTGVPPPLPVLSATLPWQLHGVGSADNYGSTDNFGQPEAEEEEEWAGFLACLLPEANEGHGDPAVALSPGGDEVITQQGSRPPRLPGHHDDRSTAGACNLEARLHEMDTLARALQVIMWLVRVEECEHCKDTLARALR